VEALREPVLRAALIAIVAIIVIAVLRCAIGLR
jgi:hypothetical protein